MMPGADRPEIQELPRISERLSYVYLEHCSISRSDSGLTAYCREGEINIPLASISSVMLGPGTSITHRAVELLGDAGTSICWVGEGGIKCYAFGSPLTHSSALAEKQARCASNTRTRLAVARKMYQMRFPGEDVSRLTMQQLRGREGSRIRRSYRKESGRTGVPWNGRSYRPDRYEESDAVNAALSVANSCLYGIAYSAICTVGCVPSLGFVHCGHEKSFVYDVADLYKTETSIPVAFDVAASGTADIWRATRRLMRETIRSRNILERMVRDIQILLSDSHDLTDASDILVLWDKEEYVQSGTQYSEGPI
jgi:CRISPR-associated protein Cas1